MKLEMHNGTIVDASTLEYCSDCGERTFEQWLYCPHCGAEL